MNPLTRPPLNRPALFLAVGTTPTKSQVKKIHRLVTKREIILKKIVRIDMKLLKLRKELNQ